MSCDYPRNLYLTPHGPKLYPPKGWDEPPIEVACTLCIGCQLDKQFEWGVRVTHELQFHEQSWFVTLTYDNENLPADMSLQKRDHQLFLKKLRRRVDKPIRFLLCGEYGGKTGRPHYHAILFGLTLDDLEPRTRNKRGELLYDSQFLEKVWGKGFVTVGEANINTGMYVAGYTLKDTTIKRRRDEKGQLVPFYVIDKETGEVKERTRPYLVTSNRGGGIGAEWFKKYGNTDVRDNLVIRSHKEPDKMIKVPVPRYYRKLQEREDPIKYEQEKQQRILKMLTPQAVANRSDERLAAKVKNREAKMKMYTRASDQEEPGYTVLGKFSETVDA